MNSSDWKRYKLGEISKEVSYGYTASASNEIVGPKFLRITDIVSGLNWETVPYCEIEDRLIPKYKLNVGDIVVARTGATTGTAEVIKEEVDAVFASYLIMFRVNEESANPFFIGYCVKSGIWNEYVKSIIGGSAQPGANAEQFADFELLLPDLPTQQKIASILSSLDDKIELNRQMAATLEAIAQALFKEWFVEYRFPGSSSEMDESEAGDMPAGWRAFRLNELLQSVSQTHKFPKDEIIFLNTSDIEAGRILHQNFTPVKELPGQAKKSIKKLDILFTEIRPGNKRYALIDFDADDFVVSTKLMVLRCLMQSHTLLLYCFLTSYPVLAELQHLAESRSGTFPQMTFDILGNLTLGLPTNEQLVERFSEVTWPLFERVKNIEQEIQALTALRDGLLPRLMNTELR